jgi:hypothetical protein
MILSLSLSPFLSISLQVCMETCDDVKRYCNLTLDEVVSVDKCTRKSLTLICVPIYVSFLCSYLCPYMCLSHVSLIWVPICVLYVFLYVSLHVSLTVL